MSEELEENKNSDIKRRYKIMLTNQMIQLFLKSIIIFICISGLLYQTIYSLLSVHKWTNSRHHKC